MLVDNGVDREGLEAKMGELKEGDLVAIPAYFDGQVYPGRVVVARFLKQGKSTTTFYAEKRQCVLLDPLEPGSLMPLVRNEPPMADYFHCDRDGGLTLVWLGHSSSRNEVYAGLSEIAKFLGRFVEYEPHAAALMAAEEVRARQKAEKELAGESVVLRTVIGNDGGCGTRILG